MLCPYCSHVETKVTDKRDIESLTKRRRECLKCSRRFTTYEQVQFKEFFVEKKDGRRELFEREKLKTGILKACEKRPVSSEQMNKIVTEIEEKLRRKSKEIKTKEIGELVMQKLKKIDKVAYIRFASVYREFEDIKDFKDELKNI